MESGFFFQDQHHERQLQILKLKCVKPNLKLHVLPRFRTSLFDGFQERPRFQERTDAPVFMIQGSHSELYSDGRHKSFPQWDMMFVQPITYSGTRHILDLYNHQDEDEGLENHEDILLD